MFRSAADEKDFQGHRSSPAARRATAADPGSRVPNAEPRPCAPAAKAARSIKRKVPSCFA